MREIPSAEPYPRKEGAEKIETVRREKVKSLLESPNGQRAELSIAIAKDGAIRRVNFWDLDKTLLSSHALHLEAVPKMFPEEAERDKKDLQDVCEAGWRLGNSVREWDRMYRIYTEKQNQYRDPDVYYKEFIENEDNCKRIDGPGYPEGWHERAAAILAKYDGVASSMMEQMYKENPDFFTNEKFLIPSMVHLLEMKTLLGEMNVFMTANPRRLAGGLVRYSGLYKYGFALGTDEDMVGGGKEIAIEKLIEQIEAANLKVPRDRLVVIGDSERGDVGSGFKLMEKGGYTFQGLLVRNDMSEIELFKRAAESDPEFLRKMLTKMDITAVASKEVPKIKGQYKLGRLGSAAARKAQELKESQEKSAS